MAEIARGRKHSEETRRKMSEAKLGRPKSEDHAQAISQALSNRKFDLSHRYNISSRLTGRLLTSEHRDKIGASVSETKRRMRRDRLAAVAEAAAIAATADLRSAFNRGQALGPVDGVPHNENKAIVDGPSIRGGQINQLQTGHKQAAPAAAVEEEEAQPSVLEDVISQEKAVIEMVSLKRRIQYWMAAYEKSK